MIRKHRIISAHFLLIFILFGCRVELVNDYDAELSTHIQNVAKQTDLFYLNMLETTSNDGNGRRYSNFAEGYAKIQAELNSLLQKNKIKPLNEHSTRICEIALQFWQDYKNEHKEYDEISDSEIDLNRLYLQDIFYAMLVAEEGKKLATENTEK